MAAAASGLVWVSPRLFSKVTLLHGFDTILKAINTKKLGLRGNPSTGRKTTILLF